MKRGTIEHPKTLMLAEKLNVRLLEAVGVLESLWHWAAKYAPRGNIGRFTNRLIASGIHWHGNPEKLVSCLLSSNGDGPHGWIDEDSEHRLVIHDWSEHADSSVHKALERQGLTFCDGKHPFTRKTQLCRDGDATKSRHGHDGDATKSRHGHDGDVPALSHARAISQSHKPTASLLLSRLERIKSIRREFSGFPDEAIARQLQVDAPDAVIDSAIDDFCRDMDPDTRLGDVPKNPVTTLGRYVQEACRRWDQKKKTAPTIAELRPVESADFTDAEFENKWGEKKKPAPNGDGGPA